MIWAMVRLGIRAAHFRAAVFASALFLFVSTTALSPSAQQHVYANIPGTPPATSTLAAYAKNGQTGGPSMVPNAPFNDRLEGGRLAVDALPRFLFVLNPATSGISIYQIDSSTGALVLFVVGTSGCGGGNAATTEITPPPPLQITPNGHYQIIASATANNVPAQSITLTLAVN